jgi:hypothetical protein
MPNQPLEFQENASYMPNEASNMNSEFNSGWRLQSNENDNSQWEHEISEPVEFKLESFEPSSMNMEQRGLRQAPTHGPYKGDHKSQSHTLQEENYPDEVNCALWIIKIHPHTTLAEFIESIHTGAVFALSFMPVDENHNTKAAKLVFMTQEGAARFKDRVDHSGVWFHGLRIGAIYNRNGYLLGWKV